MLDEFL